MKKIILFGDSLFNGYRAGHDTKIVTTGVQKEFADQALISNLSLSGATTAQGKQRLNLIPTDSDIVVLEYVQTTCLLVGESVVLSMPPILTTWLKVLVLRK